MDEIEPKTRKPVLSWILRQYKIFRYVKFLKPKKTKKEISYSTNCAGRENKTRPKEYELISIKNKRIFFYVKFKNQQLQGKLIFHEGYICRICRK